MVFREFCELLYGAYLEDKNYIQKLRDRIKSEEFQKDVMYDTAYLNYMSINPRDPSTYRQKVKYIPHELDPEQGIFVYENRNRDQENWKVIKDCINKRRRNDQNSKS